MKYKFNTRWNKKILKCAYLFTNPACDRYKISEVLELNLNQYDDIKECMRYRSYKRVKGKLQQR